MAALFLFSFPLYSQNVGIGISAPLEKLHVVGNVRSTTLSGVGLRSVLADPNGTLIIGTNTGAPDWTVIGNAGTTASTNFIGTTDPMDFVIKTAGSAAANERMRFFQAGQAIYNRTTLQTGDVFSVYGNGYASVINNTLGDWAINGYVNSAAGSAIYGENATGLGVFGNTGSSVGVLGQTAGATGFGVQAFNGSATGTGLISSGNNLGGNYLGGGSGGAFTGSSFGVYCKSFVTSAAAGGAAVYGINGKTAVLSFLGGAGVTGIDSTTGTGVIGVTYGTAGNGVLGRAPGTTNFGVYALNINASGTGLMAVGNNIAAQYLVAGSGAAINGNTMGTFSRAIAAGSTGILSVSNGGPLTTVVGGSGVSGSSTLFGVVGWATSAAGAVRSGGYFNTNAGASFAYVGAVDAGGVAYKINGNGLVATIVKDLNNQNVNLICPEAPEALFQDYGQGTLVNGSAHITLDPVLTKNIVVDVSHPLRVFVQLEGQCNGVYVTNKSQNGFDVIELNNGNSNVSFSWTVVANRADETLSDGTVSHYSALRFTPSMSPTPGVVLQAGQPGAVTRESAPVPSIKAKETIHK